MAYTAAEVKQLTEATTKAQGLSVLYAALEKRQWQRNGRTYGLAGFDRSKDLVHFTATWSDGRNGVGHSRVALSMQSAVENDTGDLSSAIILH